MKSLATLFAVLALVLCLAPSARACPVVAAAATPCVTPSCVPSAALVTPFVTTQAFAVQPFAVQSYGVQAFAVHGFRARAVVGHGGVVVANSRFGRLGRVGPLRLAARIAGRALLGPRAVVVRRR